MTVDVLQYLRLVVTQRLPHGRVAATTGMLEPGVVQYVLGRGNQTRALLYESMATCADKTPNGTRHRQNIAALFCRQTRGDQRSALIARLY